MAADPSLWIHRKAKRGMFTHLRGCFHRRVSWEGTGVTTGATCRIGNGAVGEGEPAAASQSGWVSNQRRAGFQVLQREISKN